MRYLTTYLDDDISFKFGDTGTIIKLKAVENHSVKEFSQDTSLKIRIKNETMYLKTIDVVASGKQILLPTKELSELEVANMMLNYGRVIWIIQSYIQMKVF